MKKVLLIIIILTTLKSNACSCADIPTIKKSYKYSDMVFTGKILSVEPYKSNIYREGDQTVEEFYHVSVKVEVCEIFKGKSKRFIQIITGSGGGDCGYGFSVGDEYLIFADFSGIYTKKEDGFLETTICHGNRRTVDSKKWLNYLINQNKS